MQRVNLNVNCGLGMTIMCQYWFINCKLKKDVPNAGILICRYINIININNNAGY